MAAKPAKKVASKAKTSTKPKSPNKTGLKKDGTSLPSRLNQMKALEQKVTGNTRGAFGLPDNIGESRASKKLDKIGLSMGIGDYADVARYLYKIDQNGKKVKTEITKKRVSGTRTSDKATNANKKAISKTELAKNRNSKSATQVGNDNQREGYNAVRGTKNAKSNGKVTEAQIKAEQKKLPNRTAGYKGVTGYGYKQFTHRAGGKGK